MILLLALVPPAAAGSLTDQVAALAQYRSLRLATTAPAIPGSAYERAEKGDPVTGLEWAEGVNAAKAWAVGVLGIGVGPAWMAVNAEDQYAGRFGLSDSAVIAGDPHGNDRLLFQFMPLPIVADRWWVVREDMNAKLWSASGGKMWELAWEDATDPSHIAGTKWADVAKNGQPIAWSKGAWLLVPLDDGRTLAEYYVWSDPGGSLPAGPASRFAAGAMDNALSDLESLARELGAGPRTGFERPDGTPLQE